MHKAVKDKLLILLDPPPMPSAVIQILDASKEKSTAGTVVSAGKLIDELQPGDRVSFAKFAGFSTFIDGQEYRTLKLDDVMLVLDKDMPTPEINFHTDRKKPEPHKRGVIQTFN